MAEIAEVSRLLAGDVLARRKERWPLQQNSAYQAKFEDYLTEFQEGCLRKLTELYPENLFLAGGALVNAIVSPAANKGERQRYGKHGIFRIKDFDFFVVAETEADASRITHDCIRALGSENFDTGDIPDHLNGIITMRSKTCINVYIHPDADRNLLDIEENSIHETNTIMENSMVFQFILRMYQHRSQIIGMFDLWPCQIMYSGRYGLEMTAMGAFSLEHRLIWTDCTRLSPSFNIRIRKYLGRGFKLINHHGKIYTDYDLFCDENVQRDRSPLQRLNWSDANAIARASDYNEGLGDNYSSRGLIICRNVIPYMPLNDATPFLVKSMDPALPIDIDTMSNALISFTDADSHIPGILKHMDGDRLRGLHARLPDSAKQIVELIGSFHLSSEEVNRRWEDLIGAIQKSHTAFLTTYLPPFNQPGVWKVANPGEQGGGSFHPEPLTARQLWKEGTPFIQAGLSNHDYLCLKIMCGKFGLGRDILNLLCYYCIRAKASI